jgi:hypothetical protein
MKSLLSPVLSAGQCAQCKFCCTFTAAEAWETPLFSKESVRQLSQTYGLFAVKDAEGGSYTLDLSAYWNEHGEKEYAPCPFLDPRSGCVLTEDEKPFDCKIWPLRVMRRNGRLVVALTPTCVEMNKIPLERLTSFVQDSGIAKILFDEAEKTPWIIKEYRDPFPVLAEK